MDSLKNIGKIKEQVEKEHIARRRYPKKWGKLIDPEVNRFYHQDDINRLLMENLEEQSSFDLCPFQYTGEGESYFVSRGMYESLCSKCRCGRPRIGAHLIHCLQKERDRYEKGTHNEEDKEKKISKRTVPETSNGAFGFIHSKPVYQQWEQSMRYVSPVYTMPGFRVTSRPYNAIKIG